MFLKFVAFSNVILLVASHNTVKQHSKLVWCLQVQYMCQHVSVCFLFLCVKLLPQSKHQTKWRGSCELWQFDFVFLVERAIWIFFFFCNKYFCIYIFLFILWFLWVTYGTYSVSLKIRRITCVWPNTWCLKFKADTVGWDCGFVFCVHSVFWNRTDFRVAKETQWGLWSYVVPRERSKRCTV